MNDWELLQSWARDRSERAFAELVQRHLNLVYGSALRQLADPDLAQDVAQAVFLLLSRKASALKPQVILSGWLFRTTCHIAGRVLRGESRRRRRETEAVLMKSAADLGNTSGPTHWAELEPELDSAMAALPEADRNALVVRFLEGQPLRAVGQRLGMSEEAAKKRVSRAIGKLRGLLASRGVELTATALSAALLELRAEASPQLLAEQVLRSATAPGAPAPIQKLAEGIAPEATPAAAYLGLAAGLALFLFGTAYWFYRPASTAAQPLGTVEAPAIAAAEPIAPAALKATPGNSTLVLAVRAAENNQPIVAEVTVSSWNKPDGNSSQELRTDRDGVVSIPVHGDAIYSMSVWLSAEGRVPLDLRWKGHEFVKPILQHTVLMERGRKLEGLVQNEDGQPIAGARITFNNPGMNLSARENIGFRDRTSALETDNSGRFTTDKLPLPVGDRALSYAVDHSDYVRQTIPLSGPESLRTNHVVVLKRGVRVKGKVTDDLGNPVLGATVEENHDFAGPHKKTSSDGDGQFELGPFPPGGLNVAAKAPGFEKSIQHIAAAETSSNLLFQLTPAKARATDWDEGWAARKEVRVFGRVVDAENNQPVTTFSVLLAEHRGTAHMLAGTGADGSFDWPITMAFFHEFSLIVQADGYEPFETDTRPVKAGAEERFDIKLRRGSIIAGQVLTPEGLPASGAFVGLQGMGFGTTLLEGYRPSQNTEGYDTTTDGNGRFRFKPTRGVEAILAAHESGCAKVPVELAGKEPIVLLPWGAIEGRVIVNDRPVAGQGLTLTSAIENGARTGINAQANIRTDAEGRFRFPQVPAGPIAVCRLFNFNPNGTGAIGMTDYKQVEVPPGGTAQVDLGGNGRTITGKLVLSQPIPGYDWRNDLQTLSKTTPVEPASPRNVRPGTAEWRQWALQSEIVRRQIPRYFPSIAPDGSFEIRDVVGGDYTLAIAITDPPDPTKRDYENFDRKKRGNVTVPVAVPEGEGDLNIGTITVPIH